MGRVILGALNVKYVRHTKIVLVYIRGTGLDIDGGYDLTKNDVGCIYALKRCIVSGYLGA